MTVWSGDHLPEDTLDFFLRLHRARHEKRREFLRNVVDEVEDHSSPSARVARFGLMFEEMVLGWFDSLPQFGGVERRGVQPGEPRPSRPRRPGDFGEEPPPSLRKPGRDRD